MLIRTKALSPVIAAVVVLAAIPGTSHAADDAQIRALQQQIQELSRQVDALSKKQAEEHAQAQAAAATPAPAPKKAAKEAPEDSKFDKFLKGFYGTLDVSLDDTTKGMGNLTAYHWGYANPLDPTSGIVQGGNKGGPVGRVGNLGAMSSNKSNIGYRATHPIANTGIDFILQVETALDMAAAPGLNSTWTKSSNTVTGALGLGDTYIGLQNKTWGKLKFGTLSAPYKTSTDRLNPFSGMLGDYSVIMGNTGGDNRVEFGTRLDHSILYNSPKIANGFSFDLLFAPGQNVTYNNVTTPLQSPDCAGGNAPGSGNLPLNCDDGGFGDAYSMDIKFETEALYVTVAYERHKNVNRNSDGIGSNSPYYNYLLLTNSPLLDFATFNGYVAEFPGYATVASPGYLNDIGDERALKVGAQYKFPFALTVSAEWEQMKRDIPAALEFQNERQRNGTWLAMSQDLNGGKDTVSAGWAHAGATPGDPAGQHNFNPTQAGNNQANMYTVAWTHKLDKQLSYYIDAAMTVNDGGAHYDIGAGGHGIKSDCHDGTNTVFTDFSSAGPTTWGGCRELGISTGLDYKF
jgi:predicted porin/outer membrane murein-binding lipoprotein Lpp